MPARLWLDGRILTDGRRARTWGSFDGGRFHLADDDGTGGRLSLIAPERVMSRYGLPLDTAIVLDGDSLDLGDGRRLRRLRHHAPVDAEARDYLVWETPDRPPLAVIATHVTAALRYLVLRIEAEKGVSEI